MPDHTLVDRLLDRVRAEYREMPGLRLTLAQASRLWGLDRTTCAGLLDVLVRSGFLSRTTDGCYLRSDIAPRRRHAIRDRDSGEGRELELVSPRQSPPHAPRRRP
jgi:hypothetical protein